MWSIDQFEGFMVLLFTIDPYIIFVEQDDTLQLLLHNKLDSLLSGVAAFIISMFPIDF